MTNPGRPPRLLVRTMAVTFLTVALLLAVVFVVVMLTVRTEVRQSVVAQLESGQRLFAALESRRQRELQAQAATIADSPTLIAALDTIQVETATRAAATNREAIATIDRELQKVAARVEADAIVLADPHETIIDSAGRLADRWTRGRKISIAGNRSDGFDGIARTGDAVFRIVAAPLQLPDAVVGSLYLATILDRSFAEDLSRFSGARTAILSDGLLIAGTLTNSAAHQFEASVAASRPVEGMVLLDGESFAFRRLVAIDDTTFYALSSIDESSRTAVRGTMRNLAALGAAALILALFASFALARLLSKPIGRLADSVAARAASHEASHWDYQVGVLLVWAERWR